MDESTKMLIALFIYRLPALVKQLRVLLFGVIDRIANSKEDE
ncbi:MULTISPECIES: hypothetical protein [Staphylococcus]|nr:MULTISPECIES: hypothetical protein [Staphylococcus]MDW8564346.1 hypothetical protein [Staphylococcus shinii]